MPCGSSPWRKLVEAAGLGKHKKYCSVLELVTVKRKKIAVPYVLSSPTQNCGVRSNPIHSGYFSARDVELSSPHIQFVLHIHLLPQSIYTPNQNKKKKYD